MNTFREVGLAIGLLLAFAVHATAYDVPGGYRMQPQNEGHGAILPGLNDRVAPAEDDMPGTGDAPWQGERPRGIAPAPTEHTPAATQDVAKPGEMHWDNERLRGILPPLAGRNGSTAHDAPGPIDRRPHGDRDWSFMPVAPEPAVSPTERSRDHWPVRSYTAESNTEKRGTEAVTGRLTEIDGAEQEPMPTESTLAWSLGLIIGLISLATVVITIVLSYLVIHIVRLSAAVEQLADPPHSNMDLPRAIPGNGAAPQQLQQTRYTPRGATQDTIPRVQVLSGAVSCLVEGINRSRRQHGDVETGYALIGKIIGSGTSRIIRVTGLIDEGPGAARSAGHHKADREYQQRELEILQIVDAGVMYIGDAHLHPGTMTTCSSGDYRTDRGNVRESQTKEMVFAIATVASAGWGYGSSDGVQLGGLRLDFYYLGKSSNYQYCRVNPEIVEGPPIQAPDSLRRFAGADRTRARIDFDNLSRLAAYTMSISEIDSDRQSRPCIQMHHKTLGFKTIIAFGPDPGARPEVYVETGRELLHYQPHSLNGGWSGMIWFTPIVLEVEREMTGDNSVMEHCNDAAMGERSAPGGAKPLGPNEVHEHGSFPSIVQGARRGNPPRNGAQPIRR